MDAAVRDQTTMDFVDLQTFRAVVDHGGVTAAARHLHRVQSSISARLATLEQSLGCPLFERRGKALHLTPEGRHLYDRSAPLVQGLQELRSEMGAGQRAAVLRLGSMESTAAARLALPLARLRSAHPSLRLVLRTGTTGALLAQLQAAELDAALVAGPAGPRERDGLAWARLWDEDMVLVTPRGSGDARTLITFGAGCAYRAVAYAWASALERPFDDGVEIGSYHALLASVAAGMGAGVVPRSVLALSTQPDARAFDVVPLPAPYGRQTTWMVTRAGPLSPAVEALKACLQQPAGAAAD